MRKSRAEEEIEIIKFEIDLACRHLKQAKHNLERGCDPYDYLKLAQRKVTFAIQDCALLHADFKPSETSQR
tara:strand:- start:242 stop:454 length:213 start_codon:yes stop_codon:yes gene_type:complete